MTRCLLRAWLPVLGMLLATHLPGQALAQSGGKPSALDKLEEGDAIRRRVQYRGGRFEAAPAIGFTLNDAFQRNVLLGAQLTYHFTESFALGLSVFGGLGLETGLAETVKSKRAEKAEGGFSNIGLLGTLDAYYTPLKGKFALFGRSVFNYDLHVLAGIGGTQVGGSADVEDFSPAPVLGLGLRTFVNDWFAINVEVRDYIFSSALNAVTEAEPTGETKTAAEDEISNNFAVTIGFAFYFPTEPKIGN